MGKNRIYPPGPHGLRSLQLECDRSAEAQGDLLRAEDAGSDWAPQTPLQSPWCEIRVGAPAKWPTVLGGLGAPWVLFSHWGTWRLRGELSACWGRGNAANVYRLLLPSNAVCLGLWGAGGCFSLTPCSRILLVVSCSWIDVTYSCEGERGQDRPMSTLWWRHSSLHAFLLPLPQAFFIEL